MGTLHEDQYTYRSILRSIGNTSDKTVNKMKLLSPFNLNRAFYEIKLKNTVEPDRPQTTIWRMRIACWIPKSTNTFSEYVILYWFYTGTMVERTLLRVTLYVHSLSSYTLFSDSYGGRNYEVKIYLGAFRLYYFRVIFENFWTYRYEKIFSYY